MEQHSRRHVRIAVMSVVFSALGKGDSAAVCLASMQEMPNAPVASSTLDDELAQNLICVFDLRFADIEQWIQTAYDRPLTHMTAVERAVISVAVSELLAYPQTPANIIINEFIEIAKIYGTDGGPALVNGILDNIVTVLRPSTGA